MKKRYYKRNFKTAGFTFERYFIVTERGSYTMKVEDNGDFEYGDHNFAITIADIEASTEMTAKEFEVIKLKCLAKINEL